jgi:hypothetical protein
MYKNVKTQNKISLLFVLSYLLLLLGYVFTRGFYSTVGACLVLVSWLICSSYFISPLNNVWQIIAVDRKRLGLVLLWVLLISVFLSHLLYGGLYQRSLSLALLSKQMLLAAFLLCFGWIFFYKDKITKKFNIVFLALAIIIFTVKTLMIVSSPSPLIDVFDFLKYGSLELLSLGNPYAAFYHQIYSSIKPDYYAYFPFMLVFTTPFVFLFKDPRFAFIFCELAVFVLLNRSKKFRTGSKQNKQLARILSLIFLYNPISPFLIEQSYTEPFIVLQLILFVLLLIYNKKILASILVGFSLATKQYYVVIFPAIIKILKPAMKHMVFMATAFLLVMVPFFLWDSHEFLTDTVFYQFRLPPRYEGLSFTGLLKNRFGINYQPFLFIAVFLVSYTFVLAKIIKNNYSLHRIFFGLVFVLFTFFYFNKWSFVNYYYLISSLILFSLWLVISKDKKNSS